MITNYRLGFNRILYRTSGNEPEAVSVIFILPNLTVTPESHFTKINSKNFYKDVEFTKLGDYLAIFYEDGVERTSNNFKVEGSLLRLSLTKCEDCAYWVDNTCHRKSPVIWIINNTSGDSITKWPPTEPTDSCAEGVPQSD